MNRYMIIHRLYGPAVLLLLGIVALLSQAHVVRFSIFVPLLLILLGLLKLAERMALAGWEYPAPGPGPQQPGASPYGPNWGASASSSLVPPHDQGDGGSDIDGGKL